MTTIEATAETFCEDKVVSGKKLAAQIEDEIAREVTRYTEMYQLPPKLVTIQVGEDPGSTMYVRMKHKACQRVGIASGQFNLPENSTEEDLIEVIRSLNRDTTVHGILVQLPLPKHMSEERIISAIEPTKDVDGFSPTNIYRLFYGSELLSAATPQGIVTILDHLCSSLQGKHAVVVNRSTIVGKPLILMLLNRDLTVTVCHSKTIDLPSFTRQADILITAIGRRKSKEDAYLITADMVKEGAIVIDVATPNGDCDFEAMKDKVSFITPVPGGVGPMTITMLLKNVLSAYAYERAATNVLTSDAIDLGTYAS